MGVASRSPASPVSGPPGPVGLAGLLLGPFFGIEDDGPREDDVQGMVLKYGGFHGGAGQVCSMPHPLSGEHDAQDQGLVIVPAVAAVQAGCGDVGGAILGGRVAPEAILEGRRLVDSRRKLPTAGRNIKRIRHGGAGIGNAWPSADKFPAGFRGHSRVDLDDLG